MCNNNNNPPNIQPSQRIVNKTKQTHTGISYSSQLSKIAELPNGEESYAFGEFDSPHPDQIRILLLKGQSNEIFDPQFYLSFEPAWATDLWVKIVSFLV